MKSHETHIPTQQNETKKIFRIPRADENPRGPQSDQPPPPSRPQKASRLKFPKTSRLTTRREFVHLQRGGKRLVGKLICIDYRWASSGGPRLGITASTRYGDSHERNRFKRLVREAFRTSLPSLPPHIEVNVVPRQRAKGATSQLVQEELLSLIQQTAR